MIKVIDINQVEEWDSIVKEFPDYDVYYLNGYVRAFQINGDGVPMLICVSNGEYSGVCVMMKRDIADDNIFEIYNLQRNKYYDLITPYGYGGLIFNTPYVPTDTINSCFDEIVDYLKKENYVSAFFRFHPVLHNAEFHIRNTEIINLGETVAIELESEDSIWKAITSKNRNVIRKAEKSGVVIKNGKGIDLLLTFKDIYDETMRHDNAEQYYFFGKEFYESIDRDELC